MDVDMPDRFAALSVEQREHDSDVDGSSQSVPSDQDPAASRTSENGRHYANDTYFLPDDQTEATRLSVEHQAFLLLLERKLSLTYYTSTSSVRILDIGTGPGDWALATAVKYPQSVVIATDISGEIGSAADHVPSNLHFQIDDARSMPWTFENNYFDFIHMRGLAGAFTEQELPQLYSEVYRCLKPHGSLEILDFGVIGLPGVPAPASVPSQATAGPSSVPPLVSEHPSALATYNNAVMAAASIRGLSGVLDLQHSRTELLEAAGFRVQKCLRPAVALGEWSANHRDHRVGRMAAVAVLEGLEARALRLLTRDGWTQEAVRDLVERVKTELRTEGARPTVQARVVLARNLDGSWGT